MRRVDLEQPIVLSKQQVKSMWEAFIDREAEESDHPLTGIVIFSYLRSEGDFGGDEYEARPATPVLIGDSPIYEDWGQVPDGNGVWLEWDGTENHGPVSPRT